MKVFCSYNREYDRLLKYVVAHVIDRYGENLDIDSIQEIELLPKLDNPDSDGRFSGSRVELSERLYKKLLGIDVSLLDDEEAFIGAVGTLYHEMGHATDMARMPIMYNAVLGAFKAGEITTEIWAVYTFLEYIAERRSAFIHTKEHEAFCEAVAKGSWNRYKDFPAEEAFFYLTKVLVYFIVRTSGILDRDKYLHGIDNQLLSEYVGDLEAALLRAFDLLPFDDITRCDGIAAVIENYMPLFEERYS